MVVFTEDQIFVLDIFSYISLTNNISDSYIKFYYKTDGSQSEVMYFSCDDHENKSKKVYEHIKNMYRNHTACYDIKDGELIELI